jgi:hypothetical protein
MNVFSAPAGLLLRMGLNEAFGLGTILMPLLRGLTVIPADSADHQPISILR